MMAITLWEPWASLIMVGAKSHEFRPWRLGPANRRVPIVMHASARPVDRMAIADLRVEITRGFSGSLGRGDLQAAARLLDRYSHDPSVLPRGAALGTVVFGDPVKAIDEFMTDSMAAGLDPDDLNPDMWAWPVLEFTPWPQPVPASGSQGLWPWRGEVPAGIE